MVLVVYFPATLGEMIVKFDEQRFFFYLYLLNIIEMLNCSNDLYAGGSQQGMQTPCKPGLIRRWFHICGMIGNLVYNPLLRGS